MNKQKETFQAFFAFTPFEFTFIDCVFKILDIKTYLRLYILFSFLLNSLNWRSAFLWYACAVNESWYDEEPVGQL